MANAARTTGVVFAVVGVVVMLLAILADEIGLGEAPGMGVRQWAGVVIGAALAIVGFYMRRVRRT